MSLKSFMLNASSGKKGSMSSSSLEIPLEGSRGHYMNLLFGIVGIYEGSFRSFCALSCGVILVIEPVYARAFTLHGSQINICSPSLICQPV